MMGINSRLTLIGLFVISLAGCSQPVADATKASNVASRPKEPFELKTENARTKEMDQANSTNPFPRGDKAPNETFTGTVYVQPLAAKNENNNFSVASVTFEAGARAFWHNHPAGQTILVIDGLGLYQEKGKPVRTLEKGDVVLCPRDIDHWHGASAQSSMTHVVITNYKGESQVNWLQPVTDAEYHTAPD
jgi:quercetin dioxygenase-like cupin family protein